MAQQIPILHFQISDGSMMVNLRCNKDYEGGLGMCFSWNCNYLGFLERKYHLSEQYETLSSAVEYFSWNKASKARLPSRTQELRGAHWLLRTAVNFFL